jgi:hypothetical protein
MHRPATGCGCRFADETPRVRAYLTCSVNRRAHPGRRRHRRQDPRGLRIHRPRRRRHHRPRRHHLNRHQRDRLRRRGILRISRRGLGIHRADRRHGARARNRSTGPQPHRNRTRPARPPVHPRRGLIHTLHGVRPPGLPQAGSGRPLWLTTDGPWPKRVGHYAVAGIFPRRPSMGLTRGRSLW